MKQLLILTASICFIALLLPTCAPAPEPEPEPAAEPVFDQVAEEAAVRDVYQQALAAYNSHDAKAFAALHTENFEDWMGTIKGREALEKDMTEFFEISEEVHAKLLDEIGIVFVTPDVAIYKYRNEITGDVDADGKPLPPGKNLAARVLVKRNGKWLYAEAFSTPIEE